MTTPRTTRVWNKIEKISVYKFPKFLKNILISEGFDSEFALINTSEDDIKKIEERVQQKPHSLKHSKYENNSTPFQFDLGDKVAILSIPKYLKELKQNEIEKKGNKNPVNEKKFDVEDVKKELTEKLKRYFDNKRIGVADCKITSCVLKDKTIRCCVHCSICDTKFSCTKKSHWKISNLTKHISGHFRQSEAPGKVIVLVDERGEQVHRMNNREELDELFR